MLALFDSGNRSMLVNRMDIDMVPVVHHAASFVAERGLLAILFLGYTPAPRALGSHFASSAVRSFRKNGPDESNFFFCSARRLFPLGSDQFLGRSNDGIPAALFFADRCNKPAQQPQSQHSVAPPPEWPQTKAGWKSLFAGSNKNVAGGEQASLTRPCKIILR